MTDRTRRIRRGARSDRSTSTLTILGAGVTGLSASWHSKPRSSVIYESSNHAYGHAMSRASKGFVWDEGPHISFTQNSYARALLSKSTAGELLEVDAAVGSYYSGLWFPHPVQTNLWALPQPLRDSCFDGFMRAAEHNKITTGPAANYRIWLERSLGKEITHTFTAPYTRKYWCCEPESLSTDWIGKRVLQPDVEAVKRGHAASPQDSGHYITRFRYPKDNGFAQFFVGLQSSTEVHLNHEVVGLDLTSKRIWFGNGRTSTYERLLSTIPLPDFVRLVRRAPAGVREAAEALACTSVLLVNVAVGHEPRVPYHWFYVYDEDMKSTRISQIGLLSPNNVPQGLSGLQVEVYSRSFESLVNERDVIADRVVNELRTMGLVDEVLHLHTQVIRYANVVFNHDRSAALDVILTWLESHGLEREDDDLAPMTDWSSAAPLRSGPIALGGRFGQWKYFWTDDCLLRGRQVAGHPTPL